MDYRKCAQEIYDKLGGRDNLISAAHCATRIRLVTVEGDSQYELYRKALGLAYREDTSSGRFERWKSFRFFLCLKDETDFFDVLAKKGVPVEYV